MDRFFTFLKHSLVLTIFLVFGFAATYIPQSWHDIERVHAGAGLGNFATEATQYLNNVQLGGINAATTASSVSNASTALSTGSMWLKENVLDGIGWALAKRIVSAIVRDLINWINSGFQGSPMFVQDLQGFLRNVADEAIGGFIDELGGVGSFICSPFQLDVQVAIATQYAQARGGATGGGAPAPTCTLSGIVDNLEGFISGSFSEGGWDNWVAVTSNPMQYTPYGSVLTAETAARARLINAQGEEMQLLDFGDGFFSAEICEDVSGAGGTQQNCFVSNPGKVIQEQLSFNLDTGRQSLVEADEINELVAALLGQLSNMAVTGVNGLLGLSSGTGYGYSDYEGGSYLDGMVGQADELVGDASGTSTIDRIRDARLTQAQFLVLAEDSVSELEIMANNITENDTRRAQASSAAALAREVITVAPDNVATLTNMINELEGSDTSSSRRSEIVVSFARLDLFTRDEYEQARQNWPTILREDEPN
ncbi:MAG: hypothetical protein ACOC4E_00900 [Patescibacteria group bacterium]